MIIPHIGGKLQGFSSLLCDEQLITTGIPHNCLGGDNHVSKLHLILMLTHLLSILFLVTE